VANLTVAFAGIKSPNPFWLASAPPTNTGDQIHRAFEAGWGGAVWKTIGAPVLNVSNRYGSWDHAGHRMLGMNNVELISDRSVAANLKEVAAIKRLWPDRALIVSAMVESKPEAWNDIVRQIEDSGADGIELNYGCPHGMNERGMGSAIGQVPEYCEQITSWVKGAAKIPVIVKLTPNISNISVPALAAVRGGADGISLINTINSLIGVDLDSLEPSPSVGGQGSHGGYAGPAVKPIALHMTSVVALESAVQESGLPISSMGGISTWRDAAEFLLLGASTVQICTAVMHHGFRIIEDLCEGLSNWMDEKGFESIDDFRGKSLQRLVPFQDLNLRFKAVAKINPAQCIQCNLCYVACRDAAHQCIDLIGTDGRIVQPKLTESSNGLESVQNRPLPVVRTADCVGCRLCHNICPVEGCIEMVEVPADRPSRTWREVSKLAPDAVTNWEAMNSYRNEEGIHID